MSRVRAGFEPETSAIGVFTVSEMCVIDDKEGRTRISFEVIGGRRTLAPKTDFDLVVACTALEHGATQLPNDDGLKDGAIEGLRVEDWLDVFTI